MKPRTFAVVLAVAALAALGAVGANVVVGRRLFEPTVVADPYETGLRYDADRKAAAGAAAPGGAACAISAGPCERPAGGDGSLRLEIGPRPVKAMADLDFTVTALRGGQPLAGAEGEIALEMPGMYMGENRVRLAEASAGVYRGKGLLVRCPSGRRAWAAAVTLRDRARPAAPLQATFTFELAE